jgi:hypothetical protein
MSDDIKKAVAEEVARQLAELKAKEAPKPEFKPMTDAEHRDMVHQMRERQANSWMPPNAIREMIAAEPRGFMRDGSPHELTPKDIDDVLIPYMRKAVASAKSGVRPKKWDEDEDPKIDHVQLSLLKAGELKRRKL